jgi:hypothetical protein
MKTHFFKPGFEFIFSLSLMAILGLPPLVFAQNTHDVQISIQNGDTTVNGKNIKDLSPKARREALKEIGTITSIQTTTSVKVTPFDDNKVVTGVEIQSDSAGGPAMANNVRAFKFRKRAGKDSTFRFNYRLTRPGDGPRRTETRTFHFQQDGGSMLGFDRPNTQNFNYTNTDKEGVSTHITYHVSEPSSENLKHIGHFEGGMLDIQDLNLVPQFTTGKTLLLFSLPSKGVAEVQLKDNEGNILWTAKTNGGDFSKSFALGLNGAYYLQVKQGSKIAVKKIFKE